MVSDLELEIQKRHTLNWLIQGASQHAGMTFHHLRRDELNALDPRLLPLYDQFALLGTLQYWRTQSVLLLGSPTAFWEKAPSDPAHPFFGHPLLTKYGGMLAETARQRAIARCREKRVRRLPLAFSIQLLSIIKRLYQFELPHRPQLVQLAKETAAEVWGIPLERLAGSIVDRTALHTARLPSRNFKGALLQACTVGYGGVERRDGQLQVFSMAINWPILARELVKGTAELIALHGLNRLDDSTYRRVLEATDWLDLEPWMLQSGSELWRRLLESMPDGQPLASTLMHLARLPAPELDTLISTALERPDHARSGWTELITRCSG